jgi:predicted membrane chloride channel (bestrophin family)
MRVSALGSMLHATVNTAVLVTTSMHENKWEPVRNKIIKMAMASIMLVVQAARQDLDLEKLVNDKIIDEEERAVLERIRPFQRATTMWVWILRVCEKAFAQAKLPPPRYNMVLSKATQVRDGIQTIHTYLDTPLPFAYVHLVCLLVNLQNLVFAAKGGTVAAVAYANNDNQSICVQVLMVLIVCVIYQGLLCISYIVSDPFGDDLLDFPVVAYTEYLSWSFASIDRAVADCPALTAQKLEHLLGSQPPPDQEGAEKKAEPPASQTRVPQATPSANGDPFQVLNDDSEELPKEPAVSAMPTQTTQTLPKPVFKLPSQTLQKATLQTTLKALKEELRLMRSWAPQLQMRNRAGTAGGKTSKEDEHNDDDDSDGLDDDSGDDEDDDGDE